MKHDHRIILTAEVLAVMAYRGGMSIYLLLVALQGANMPTSAQGQLEQHRKLFFVRVQRAVDQRLAQLAFLSATLLYGFLEIQDAYPVTSEVVGYLLLLGFFCEFFCRAKAQGGESFFRPFYNKLELCVLAGGTWCLFYGTWYTEYLAEEKDQRAVVATATVCLLLLHRCIRLLAIRFQVSASDLHANTLMSAKALEVFIAKFGDLVEVPPTNIHVDVPGSRVHIEKATLKREVFEELHLPVTVQGGLIEDLFIDFFTPSAGARGAFARVRTHGRTKVRIKNLLLVTGAGRGLAEAGGSYGSYWTAEKIFEAKSRVVELIYKRLSAPFPDLRSLSQQSIDSRTKSTLAPSWTPPQAGPRQIAQKLRWKLGDSVFRHLELEIQNASLQFQDSTGALGHGCLSMGLKVDSLSLVRHARKRLTLDLARLAFYVEPHGPEASWQSKSLSRDRPQQVVQKMVRLNCAERLRSWAFSELRASMGPEQRLRHAERWPERHHVLTIPCVSLHAGPRQAEGEEEAPSQGPAPRASDSAGSLGRALTRLTHVSWRFLVDTKIDLQSGSTMPELQMHLPYPDIVSCGRAALAKAVKGEPALRAVEVAAEEVIRSDGRFSSVVTLIRSWSPVGVAPGSSGGMASRFVSPSGDVGGAIAPFCSTKSFSVASPEAGRHRPGAREILQVRRPVKMSSTLFDASYRVAPPEMLPGDVFAFVVQAKATGQAKEISAVLHAPELKLLLWEPLLLTLKAFTTRSGGRAGRGTLSLLERGRTTVGPMDGRVTAENGRVGPSKVKASGAAAQRFFERYAVIRDEVALDLVVHLGAIQVFQVGQFSKDQLGVEEARIFPRRVWAKVAHDEIAKSCALGIEDVGRGPAAPWIAGASHAEPGVRQEAPVEPPTSVRPSVTGTARRPRWRSRRSQGQRRRRTSMVR
eukprot:g32324.t1